MIQWSYDVDNDRVTKVLDDMYNANTRLVMDVQETQEAFIFSILDPYVQAHSGIEITKEELFRAITLVRMQRAALETYGVSLSNDWSTATAQNMALNEAYMRGVQDGITKEHKRIMDKLEGEK